MFCRILRRPGVLLNQASARSLNRAIFTRSYPFLHGGPSIDKKTAQKITVNWLYHDGKTRPVSAYVGQTLLQVAHAHKIELEGACEGVCACSTCHTIFTDPVYDSLPYPSEDEEDMLDLAYGLEPTSRLGCQVTLTEEMDGVEVRIPQATRNFYVDGHVPQPH
ncbi:hypothetical protein TrCOL_g4506 [Triparma columacea]|uniref:2Fe-2S ferredoxin-type domain-containing protein n=1 Tax=Triparma columacea TaxID=722753 RepID=A0A9W7FWZ3_9STRA|nr:hypothetical protein TrCOL_g4506 [Triparma columacea]